MEKILKGLLFVLGFAAILSGQSIVPENAVVEKIASGFQFVEGPVWHEDGYLLFSDIPANKIFKWTEAEGTTVYLSPSGNSNGLAFDKAGRLILCQHGPRQIARQELDGSLTVLAAHYNGKQLNSPNDLAIHSNGSLFFTDPPYGIQANQQELNFTGIFRLDPGGTITLLDQSVNYPNGICFSPDESKLYVNDSQLNIFVWDVVNGETLANKMLLARMTGNGYADGMKIDTDGHIYSTGPAGVHIFRPDGLLLDEIAVPGQTANCAWGGQNKSTLFMTSGDAVYKIELNAQGKTAVQTTGHLNPPQQFQLLPNYPNPFNPATTIAFQLNRPQPVRLSIFNTIGQEVAVALNTQFLSAGHHQVLFDARGLCSGTYYYRLNSDCFETVRSMVLIK